MKKYLSPLILFTASVIWGFAFVAQKAATAVPPFTLLFSRSLVGSLFLIPIIVLFDKIRGGERRLVSLSRQSGHSRRTLTVDISKTELIGGAICGVFLFAASALQQFGISGTDAGKTSFITALYVVIVPIYALFFGKRSPLNTWIGVALAIVGFYLLCISESFSLAPSDLLILLCAFTFAVQIMAIDRFSAKTDGVRLSFIQFVTASVLSLILMMIFELPTDMHTLISCTPEILFLGIGSSGIAYTCQIIGQKGTHPAVASVILSLESVFGTLASAVMLGERMTPREYAGCAVVFVAVVIAQLDFTAFRRKKADSAPR